MSTVPIPQGATIGEASASATVPIPQGATIGDPIPTGDEMRAQVRQGERDLSDRYAQSLPLMAGGGLKDISKETFKLLPLLKPFFDHPVVKPLLNIAEKEAMKIPGADVVRGLYNAYKAAIVRFGEKAVESAEGADAAAAEVPAAEATAKVAAPSSYPPEAPKPVMQQARTASSRADFIETKSIQEQIRDAANAEDRTRLSQAKREWFADNVPGKTKGELTGQVEKPVKLTRTPGVKTSGTALPKAGTKVPEPGDELLELLQKSLDAARKAKR